jgi:tetratricopeptide (TPR) repeat protein
MRNRWLAPLLIAAVALAAYSNTFRVPFIFDDRESIVENPRIESLLPLTSSMSWQPQSAVAGRPIVCFSLALNHAISGRDVWSYHALNLLVHMSNALLLFGIIRRTLPKTRNLKPETLPPDAPRSTTLAAAIALLWVAHPLNTEAVTYVVQRTELLFAFFLLLTLYCVIRGTEQRGSGVPPLQNPTKRRDAASTARRGWFLAAIVSCALGMGCKEVMAVAPVLVLLYDRVFLAANWRDVFQQRGFLHTGLMATWLIVGALVATAPRSATAGFGVEISPWNYLLTQSGVILHYLRLAVFPYPLSLDYSDWKVASGFGDAALTATVVLALLAANIWALWKKPALGFLGACFFLILAPSSSFVPIATELAAERRMYLPLAAVVALIVLAANWGIEKLLRGAAQQSRVKFGVTAALVSLLAAMTFARNRDYRDELALWIDVAEKRPNNATAQHQIGVLLNQRGETDKAQRYFAEAMRLRPALKAAYLNTQGIELARAGKFEEAIARYEEALRIVPDLAAARTNWGAALFRLGRVEEALAQYEIALRLAPYDAATQYHVGVALLSLSKTDEAIRHFREALRIKPDAELAHGALGRALLVSGDFADGIKHLREALRLKPDLHSALNDLARVRATANEARWRDGAEAVRLAQRACEMTNFANAEYLDTLTAALAETGDFAKAIETAEKAAQLAGDSGRTELVEQIQKRLESYRAGKPWRE